MVRLEPEYRRRNEKADYLGTREIKQAGVPRGTLAELRILALVEGCAVKLREREAVLREIRGHPVHDNADVVAMEGVDEVHQILGRAVARGRRKVARRLEAPARVVRVLHQRHELNVGKVHVAEVVRQLVGKHSVGVEAAVGLALPRARVDLVDIHGQAKRIRRFPALDPLSVAPFVAPEVINL